MASTTNKLRRDLNRRDGISLVTGMIIGSGIFASPGIVLTNTNGAAGMAMLIWLGGSAIALCSSFVYGELGTFFPFAGGDYNFIKNTFGDMLA